MSYEVEHSIAKSPDQSEPSKHARRPDLSSFFSKLEQIDTSGEHTPHNNRHAEPIPADVEAAARILGDAFVQMRNGSNEIVLDDMIQYLRQIADNPGERKEGVSDEFIAKLDRVPKSRLKKDQDCPICGNAFLDDEYPLVVELPCHKDHRFDLECITPWLKVNPTCPLDRKELVKKKPPPPPVDEEEDYDDYYA